MRILIDARLYGLENTGIGRYVMNLVDNLARIDRTNNYVILLRKKYFSTLNFPENWKKVLTDFRHYSFAEQLRLPRIIKKENPDITHFPHFNTPLLFNGKFTVTIHDMLMHKSFGLSATTLPAFQYIVRRLGYKTVFAHAVKKSVKVIVPSSAVGEELIKGYGINKNKVAVTYEGFDSKISIKRSIEIEKPYFTYLGNAYPHKNLDNLIKAIKILNTKSNQKAILAISGARNIFTQRIEKIIQKEKAEEFVKLFGFVPDDKLGSFLANSVAFVFPTLSEGFGLPGLEAMGVGTLVLASNIPVLKEVYRNNALYFDPKKPEAIAKSMEDALAIPQDEREDIIRKAMEFVKIYSWDKMARQTLEIYEESCNSIRQGQ